MDMNQKYPTKVDMYKAIGFTMFLLIAAFPVSILGMKLLNLLLANVQI
jgi:hypothetical protein